MVIFHSYVSLPEGKDLVEKRWKNFAASYLSNELEGHAMVFWKALRKKKTKLS